MTERSTMPARGDVDALFDGHLERPLLELTVLERLDWIWAAMQLLHIGAQQREQNQKGQRVR